MTSEPPLPDDDEPSTATASDTAIYVRQMAAELAGLARGAKLEELAYLLDMVELAATRSIRDEQS